MTRRGVAGTALALGLATAVGSGDGRSAAPAPGSPQVVGYFVQWGPARRGYHVKDVVTSGAAPRLTRINYAFADVTPEGDCRIVDPEADYGRFYNAASSVDGVADSSEPGALRGNFNQLRKLKSRYPGLKVLISLGGWELSGGFSAAARTADSRRALVADCVDTFVNGGFAPGLRHPGVFDGIDVDWEYPAACGLSCGTPEDTRNFVALLAEFRRQLDQARRGLLLTVAAPAGIDKLRVFGAEELHPYLDAINVMAYDLHGAWEPITNFHAPLYGTAGDPSTGDARSHNVDFAIGEYLRRGVPPGKLLLGVPFYGRGWTGVPDVNHGLYQPGRPAPGSFEPGADDYEVLRSRSGFQAFRHPEAQAPWLFDGTTFWTYDDPVSVAAKMAYAKRRGLAGAMFWELSGDDARGSLVAAVHDGLR
jgi:chitinase